MLVVLGILLVVGPIGAGLFVKVASGQQMIDGFAPHMTPDALGRYGTDLQILRNAARALDAAYAAQHIPAGKHPGLDVYRAQAPAINDRAQQLLDRIRSAEPDYRKVSAIGGFDRVPFLLVVSGLALSYSGAVLLGKRRQRRNGAVVLALVAATALIAYPLLGNLPSGSRAGERLQHALAPVMTRATVRAEQLDFVTLVQAVGELDTSFAVERRAAHSADLESLDSSWPGVSSDLASLVGAINDNLTNYRALDDLDALTHRIGVSGLIALPWFLLGAGALSAVAAGAALSRPRKEQP